jgi:hypothetical protein
MTRTASSIIWDHILRHYPDTMSLSVDDLTKTLRAEKHVVERYELVALFKEYAGKNMGTFYSGRRGHPTRLVWRRKPRDLGAAAPEGAISAAQTGRMLEHPLPIRPGLSVRLTLPEDLTAAEANRVATFVQSLPLT